ncbi:thioesterase [Actinomadura luteofluorescens]|uniref:thioesterase n=1 Tax=Actinomadura luteofluorescens TaxID=46163 RepID=UPI003638EA2A
MEEISLEVENLEAHVSLVAEVLDLLKLNVGADVFLGRVKLEIKGVEAEAELQVRLDNVAIIVDRVLTTLDRNPEILQHIGRGLESAVSDIGSGTGSAVGEVGKGARGAVEDVGRGAAAPSKASARAPGAR